ncbi:MAG: succinate dehydrogenase, cytochrome b556 subunit [Proteobacteria bacterium]|nr:succinate dehydrogenase, cytochrome b556 subunit [Pseudomonadota bacterium]
MDTGGRPLSPHLQVYKPQITSVLSILHRITGVALAAGTLLLVWWLIAASVGPGYFNIVQSVIGSWIGRLLLFGWSFALFYHLCNGIRHLFWDMGRGYELPTVAASGWAVVIMSLALTGIAWVWGYMSMGAL